MTQVWAIATDGQNHQIHEMWNEPGTDTWKERFDTTGGIAGFLVKQAGEFRLEQMIFPYQQVDGGTVYVVDIPGTNPNPEPTLDEQAAEKVQWLRDKGYLKWRATGRSLAEVVV